MGVFIADAMTSETRDRMRREEIERSMKLLAKEIRELKIRVKSLEEKHG